jgi:excisionase family DNA binding protein
MSALLQENSPLIPRAHDIALAEQSSKELAALFSDREKDFQMSIKVDKREAKITVPFSAIKLFLEILTQMAEGNAITLIPIHAELTTQEAADLLNVSRPFLITLLEKGKIPFHKIGTHRRIRFVDLLHFKELSEKISQKALDELVEQAQELDMGY